MKKILLIFIFLIMMIFSVTVSASTQGDYIIENPIENWEGFDIDIYKSKSTDLFYSDIDASDYMHVGEGKTYYVSQTNGSNDNDGLTRDTPFYTIYKAINQSDVDIIRIIDDGWFSDGQSFNNIPIQKNLSIIADEGLDVYIAPARSLTYTKTNGYTNIYEASRTLLVGLIDISVLDENDMFPRYVLVSSLEEVDSTPGSYFYENSIVYIHTFDSRPADADVKAFLNVKNMYFTGTHHLYLENIKVYGGHDEAVVYMDSRNTDKGTFVAKNVEFGYTFSGNLRIIRLLNVVSLLQNVKVISGDGDGISYAQSSMAIELDVLSAFHGLNGNDITENSSTAHSGSKVIRINGEYHSSAGPVIHDINENTQSLNIQNKVYNSTSNTNYRNVNYQIESMAKMYVISPDVDDSAVDFVSNAAAQLYLYNFEIVQEKIFVSENSIIEKIYLVNYETNGGSLINSEFVIDGEKATPRITGRINYTFGGWYIDYQLSNMFNILNTQINQDTTLYARWISQDIGTGFVIGGNKLTVFQSSIVVLVLMLIGFYFFNSIRTKKGRIR